MRCAIPAVALCAIAIPSVTAKKFPPLRFAENGTFHITLFEDLHMGESELSPR